MILKKLAAIFLLFIFLFNIGGYRLWFYYQQQQSDETMEAIIDRDEYEEDQLITLKVPMSLPYQTNWKEFERVDGEINLHGKIYKYVKRKIFNGELILLCLPHHNKMRVEQAKSDFFKYANDLMQNTSSKKSDNSKLSFKLSSSEYEEYLFSFHHYFSAGKLLHVHFLPTQNLPASPHQFPEQPPDFAA